MVESFIEALKEFKDDMLPIAIVWQYQRGVYLKGGKFKKVVGPGIHWKIPFVDDIAVHDITLKSLTMVEEQRLVTKDGYNVEIRPVMCYKIKDIKKYILDLDEDEDTIAAALYSTIDNFVRNHNWSYIRKNGIDEVKEELQELLDRVGIDVDMVGCEGCQLKSEEVIARAIKDSVTDALKVLINKKKD